MSGDEAGPRIVPVPEEVADAALEAHARKDVCRAEIVVNRAYAVIREHRLPELVQALAAGEPPGRNDHRQQARA